MATRYTCLVTHDDDTTSRFISHHPDRFVEWPLIWDTPTSPEALDDYMLGRDRAVVPMKYARGWLDQIAEADWCRSVEFTEEPWPAPTVKA